MSQARLSTNSVLSPDKKALLLSMYGVMFQAYIDKVCLHNVVTLTLALMLFTFSNHGRKD